MPKIETSKVYVDRNTFVAGELLERGKFENLPVEDAKQACAGKKCILVTEANEKDLKARAAAFAKAKKAAESQKALDLTPPTPAKPQGGEEGGDGTDDQGGGGSGAA